MSAENERYKDVLTIKMKCDELRKQVEQLSASNARMAALLTDSLHKKTEEQFRVYANDVRNALSSSDHSAWLAEQKKAWAMELHTELVNITLIPGAAVQQIMAAIESRTASKNG